AEPSAPEPADISSSPSDNWWKDVGVVVQPPPEQPTQPEGPATTLAPGGGLLGWLGGGEETLAKADVALADKATQWLRGLAPAEAPPEQPAPAVPPATPTEATTSDKWWAKNAATKALHNLDINLGGALVAGAGYVEQGLGGLVGLLPGVGQENVLTR